MFILRNILNIFNKRERNNFFIIFFGIFIVNILDVISFATIIPIFNIVFLNKIPHVPFANIPDFKLTFNLKILFLVCFVFLFYLKNLLIIAFNYFFIRFYKNISSRIANDLFYYFLNQDYIFFLKKSSENFLQKINNDINQLNTFLISLINLSIEVIFLVLISFLLLGINYKIFLICFISFSFVLIIYYRLFQERIKKWSYSFRSSTGEIQKLIIEGTQGFKDILLYNLKSFFIKKFDDNVRDSSATLSRINFLNNVQRYWLELVAFSVLILALIYFVTFDFDVRKLIPVFGLFIITMFRFLTSVNKIINSAHLLKFSYPSAIAISNEFINFKKNESVIYKLNKDVLFEKSIDLLEIKFSYDDKNLILNDFTFKINKGESIIISGKNGSGKTTLLNMIAGLIKPLKGQVISDNTFDIYSSKENWFKNISYVQQNIFLLDTNLKHNIVLTSDDNINLEKFNKVLDVLKLNEFFSKLPDQLSTKVGINGISLSGGQKQIISLARALYKDSDIFIFDEATSALDIQMTERVKKLILSLKGKKTIIMVCHDVDYFSSCFDKIVEINNGGIKILK